ncbi:MAG TPA: ROK family protein [Candidatus Acidoferrales bacterium]|jgi:fructokinase|nr:ROK family protein [Candidatus Acidoferrales bacterium]
MRIGIDLGGTKIEIAVLDREGTMLLRRRVPTPAGDYTGTLEAVAALVAVAEAELGRADTIGIGIPGSVSPSTGLVRNANSTVLIGKPLDRDLEQRLGRPIRMDNDANCFILSECNGGATADANVAFGVILGTGVGGGIAFESRPYDGRNAIAGEWGHTPLPWLRDDEVAAQCYCGRTGCIETFLSGPRLSEQYRERTGHALNPSAIELAASSGDADAEAVLIRYEDRLARGLAVILDILDPDVIVFGGGLSNIERLYTNVPPLLAHYAFADHVDTPLRRAHFGDSSGVRGAAML